MITAGWVSFDGRQPYRGVDRPHMRFGTRSLGTIYPGLVRFGNKTLGQFEVPVFTGGPKPTAPSGTEVTSTIKWLGPADLGCDPFWTEQNGACSDELGNFIEPGSRDKRPGPFDWRAFVKKYKNELYIGAAVIGGLALMRRRR